MKKLICAALCFALIIQTAPTAFAAFDSPKLSRSEWDTLYESLCNENTLPTLCVGADETQLNLVWHAPTDTAIAKVRLANNVEMTQPIVFDGSVTEAETPEQVVCRVTVTGIEENSVYFYQWYTGSEWSEVCKYESKSFKDHKAVVVGDIQIGGQSTETSEQSDVGFNWNNVLSQALSADPDISYLLSPGDNTSTGKGSSEWQTLLMPRALRSLPIALAIGNHDKKGFSYHYYTGMPNEYYGKYFTELDRDFWFRYGDVLYLFFDATSGSAHDHMAMAREAVEANQDAKWRIGVMHQALFGAGYSQFSAETQILLNGVFTPIFDTYDIDLVLTGHSHLQGRSHFLCESSVVGRAESGKTYTDPKGVIYLNSNSMCDHGSFNLDAYYLAYSFIENDVSTYTTLGFYGNTLEIKTKRGDNSEVLDSVTIEKTKGHNDDSLIKRIQRILYKFVELLGLVYMKIDSAIVSMRGGHY